MPKHFLALISSIILLCDLAPALADSPFDIAPTRYPFLPSLVEINEPQVCSSFLAAVTDAYKGQEFDIKTVGYTLPDLDAHWLLSAEDIAAQFEGTDGRQLQAIVPLNRIRFSWDYITSTEVDFAGNGSTNVLAIIGSEDGALRRYYVAALFDTKAEFHEALGATSVEEITKHAIMTWRLDRPSVLEVNGSFYAVTNPQSFDMNDTREELWRLTSSGVQLACAVQLDATPNARFPKTRLAGTVIENLDRVLSLIAGQESRCGGSLHFMDRSVIHAAQVLKRAESRPWALREIDPHNDPAEIDAALYRWSQRGIWNYRMLRELRRLVDPARDFLKAYYRDGFGLPQESADRLADTAFDLLIRSRFIFPRQPQPIDMDDPTFKLRDALLAHSSEQTIKDLLKTGAAISNAYVEVRWGISAEPTLFYALESPAMVDLLLMRGADVNARGNFDKTALMYAVQFNLFDTTALLLERGADVNAKTSTTGDCWSNINVTDRTALMYAAENADLAMVELLLQHGADPRLLDSAKRSADIYVERNETLTADARRELYARLREARGAR